MEGKMNIKRYTCVQKCPELDYDNKKHCSEYEDGYCHKYTKEHGCCPVGNLPIWKEVEDDKQITRDCRKCVYEVGCHKNPVGCTDYKRDAPDGGYYG